MTVTDTRAGDLPWTASATVTNFTDAASDVINGQNLTFTGVTADYIRRQRVAVAVTSSPPTSRTPLSMARPPQVRMDWAGRRTRSQRRQMVLARSTSTVFST